jgi:hypothetical protein
MIDSTTKNRVKPNRQTSDDSWNDLSAYTPLSMEFSSKSNHRQTWNKYGTITLPETVDARSNIRQYPSATYARFDRCGHWLLLPSDQRTTMVNHIHRINDNSIHTDSDEYLATSIDEWTSDHDDFNGRIMSTFDQQARLQSIHRPTR